VKKPDSELSHIECQELLYGEGGAYDTLKEAVPEWPAVLTLHTKSYVVQL
jgi:hypothetical protein